MKRLILTMILAILIVLYLCLLAVYSQEEKGVAPQRPGVNVARQLMRLLDLDKDGRISSEEYMKFFGDADENKDGSVTQEEIANFLSKLQSQEAKGPDVGQEAPDFTLRTLDGKETVKLFDFRGKKPVVLVFGSYT